MNHNLGRVLVLAGLFFLGNIGLSYGVEGLVDPKHGGSSVVEIKNDTDYKIRISLNRKTAKAETKESRELENHSEARFEYGDSVMAYGGVSGSGYEIELLENGQSKGKQGGNFAWLGERGLQKTLNFNLGKKKAIRVIVNYMKDNDGIVIITLSQINIEQKNLKKNKK